MSYDLVVIGLGSAGLTAAKTAAELGLRVCAIERGRIGGDCLWTGCVPSKTLLASAKAAHAMRTADTFGIAGVEPEVDGPAVLARVRAVQDRIAEEDDSREILEADGIDVVLGAPRLTSARSVAVDGHGEVRGRRIVLATGSRADIPPIPGLQAAGHLTAETVWDLPDLPERLAIIGGGPVGCELAQAFRRLGTRVVLLQRGPRLLPRDEPRLSARLRAVLEHEGVDVRLGARVRGVTRRADATRVLDLGEEDVAVDEVLVATGRVPNVEGLGLEALGITVGPRGIDVDDALRTAARGVYAAGDVVGRHRFTHTAAFEAVRAVRNAVFPLTETKAYAVPWCTFTDPELAHAGLTADEARARHGDDVHTAVLDLARNDRARADGREEGAIVLRSVKGRLVGADILAPAAGETIHELALAIHAGMRVAELARVIHVYPTVAVGIQQLAGDAALEQVRKIAFLATRRLPGRDGDEVLP